MMRSRSIAANTLIASVIFLAVAATAGGLSVWSTNTLAKTGEKLGHELAPLVDAAVMTKLAVVEGFLRTQQLLGGNESVSVKDVEARFDEAEQILEKVVLGGWIAGRHVPALQSEVHRKTVDSVSEMLKDLRAVAQEQLDWQLKTQRAGSVFDETYDALYQDLVERIAQLALTPELVSNSAAQNALGDARYLLAHGHLVLEEILAGDVSESLTEVAEASTGARGKIEEVERFAARPAQFNEIYDLLTQLGQVSIDRTEANKSFSADRRKAQSDLEDTYAYFVDAADEMAATFKAQMQSGMLSLGRVKGFAVGVASASSLIILLMAGTAYGLISRFISSRIKDLSEVMTELSSGNVEVPIPEWQSGNEIGTLKENMQIFKSALQERDQLMQAQSQAREVRERDERRATEEKASDAALALEKEVQERTRNEARVAQSKALEDEMKRVIDQARRGDFSARILRDFDEASLQDVKTAVNSLVKSVEEGLSHTVNFLHSLAKRDVTARIDGEFEGAFAKLKHDANRAAQELSKTIAEISINADEIQGNASEIASGAEAVSKRTEHTAATLEETAAAFEQITASVSSAAQSAKKANEIVGDAMANANASSVVVGDAVIAMQDIEANSDEISKTIDIIEDIAFQTNLLALNAGVEAARAGESGRGFAVVATEVRALAQRASEAAGEINNLIQKSGSKVKQGVKLVGETGTVLTSMMSSIEDISGLVSTIKASADEQATSISEINKAVRDLDKTTQMNAAMSEETTGVSQSLSVSAGKMISLVKRFEFDSSMALTPMADVKGVDIDTSTASAWDHETGTVSPSELTPIKTGAGWA